MRKIVVSLHLAPFLLSPTTFCRSLLLLLPLPHIHERNFWGHTNNSSASNHDIDSIVTWLKFQNASKWRIKNVNGWVRATNHFTSALGAPHSLPFIFISVSSIFFLLFPVRQRQRRRSISTWYAIHSSQFFFSSSFRSKLLFNIAHWREWVWMWNCECVTESALIFIRDCKNMYGINILNCRANQKR